MHIPFAIREIGNPLATTRFSTALAAARFAIFVADGTMFAFRRYGRREAHQAGGGNFVAQS